MTALDRPLYLHFLDRELGQSVSFIADPRLVEYWIKCLLLGTTAPLYCGLSLLWESPGVDGGIAAFVASLIQSAVLDAVSHHATAGEFLESRRLIYQHDLARYPMYFLPAASSARSSLKPTLFKSGSTTEALSEQMLIWAVARKGVGGLVERDNRELLGDAQKFAADILVSRETEAITYALFSDKLSSLDPKRLVAGILQRKISVLYTDHYSGFGGADIATGIPGLDYFDEIAREFPFFDVPLLSDILRSVGWDSTLQSSWRSSELLWASVGAWRGGWEHGEFRRRLRLLFTSLVNFETKMRGPSARPPTKYEIRHGMLKSIRNARAALVGKRGAPPSWPYAAEQLDSIIEFLRRNTEFARIMEEAQVDDTQGKIDVLIVTATEIERDAILEQFTKETGNGFRRRFGARKTYYDVGFLGGVRIAVVQCEMGSGGPGASLTTVSDACDELTVSAILVVGIAFGVNPGKQAIGDILVSKQLQCYELQRIGTDSRGGRRILARGDKVSASSRLLDRFRGSAVGWTNAKVQFGLLLSGEKLIDNVDFRDELLAIAPEAAGGEMEGAGTYAAAQVRNKEWVIVKAICDWADGKKRVQKEKRQRLAADNAAAFVVRTIGLGGFSL